MKIIKKELLPIIVMLMFIGAYIGTAQAKNFYYFDTLPGLVLSSDDAPFDAATTSTGNVSIDVDNIVLEAGASGEVINYNISVSGGVIISDVSIIVEGNDEAVVTVGVDPGETGFSRTLSLTSISSGETSLTLQAVVSGVQEDSANVNITVASACSTPIDTTDVTDPTGTGHVMLCDSNNNYLISSVEDLLHLSHNQTNATTIGATTIGIAILEGNYKMMNNIAFNSDEALVDWDGSGVVGDGTDAEGWMSLGWDYSNLFLGIFDGGGNVISNLYINRASELGQGLFGYSIADFYNLGVVDVEVTGGSWTGALVGRNSGDVINCYSTGTVIGGDYTGGLVGEFHEGGNADNSYSTCSVAGVSRVGGLVGNTAHGMGGATVDNSYATGNVVGTGDFVGGLIGAVGKVINSFATGNVTGVNSVGGLGGFNTIFGNTGISNTYATGNVIGVNYVGGLFGKSALISNSYSTGAVSGSDYVGGLAGESRANGMMGTGNAVSNSYSEGSVSGTGSNIGSLLGTLYNGSVSASYALNDMLTVSGSGINPSFDIVNYCSESYDSGCVVTNINVNWDDAIWSGLETATPTLKNMPN